MAKMRATMHNGRTKANGKTYGAKHNDRNFDKEKADNIDPSRSELNYTATPCYHDRTMTFEEAELRFYEEHFGEQLRRTNEAYERNGHPERCKTMEKWKALRRNAPEETILQIGKMDEHVDRLVLFRCHRDYNRRLEAWNKAHGNPFTTLTVSLHADEAVPHIHTRRVWHYRDEQDLLKIGQEKALAAAGVELPDPGEPEGRRNNRKMTFDAMCREMWLDVLYEHGLDIDRDPVPFAKHNMEKQEMIREKYAAMLDEMEFFEAQITADREEIKILSEELADKSEQLQNVSQALQEARSGIKAVKEEAQANLAQIEAQIASAREDLVDAQRALTVTVKAGVQQYGMEGYKSRIDAAREERTEKSLLNQLLRFVAKLPVKALWEQFQRDEEKERQKGKVYRHIKE